LTRGKAVPIPAETDWGLSWRHWTLVDISRMDHIKSVRLFRLVTSQPSSLST
jgi:hypothetical protein